ncbi:ras family-domain-containing protein [Rhodotorula diobovata]|uniref:Ras family-domain-containing protein n=1 Tax=Rhodotorula diobovata TaxID=5288 RepID=A0A5C5FRG9_9BASI|nr:ras family-domain-containing protein [Rhodotorula diobovata]
MGIHADPSARTSPPPATPTRLVPLDSLPPPPFAPPPSHLTNLTTPTQLATRTRKQGGAFRRKLVIVGDGACGKTSLLSVFSMGEFPREYTPTIFENYVAEIRLDGKAVQLALWDTAGQEEYERLRPLSYSKSHVILIAFALDTPDSLDNVSVKWIEEVRELCGPHIPVLLVGLKMDLRDEAMRSGGGAQGRFVTTEQGRQMATQIGARSYHECSALLNSGVDETFEAATRAAMLVRGAGAGAGGSHSLHAHGEDDEREKRRRRDKDEGAGGGACGCVIL